MSALQGDSHLTVSYTGREQEDTRKGQGSTKDQQQHAWAFSVMSGAGKGQIWGIIFWVKKFRRWQNWVFEWGMKCHLAGKHSIFQHLLCLVRNRSKQWQIPCTPILQVLKDDQIHISACSEGLSELRKLLPCSKHQSTDRNPLGNTPKHPLYLRICESLPSIPLTQSASQATSCGLGMCKSRAITASQTAISIFNITIPFAKFSLHTEKHIGRDCSCSSVLSGRMMVPSTALPTTTMSEFWDICLSPAKPHRTETLSWQGICP